MENKTVEMVDKDLLLADKHKKKNAHIILNKFTKIVTVWWF